MAGVLSHDLRSRVLAAVDDGMSRQSAAERFGIGVATAIRWVRAWRDEGRPMPLPMGGDVRSHRIEAFREVILEAIEMQKDMTLAELAEMLRRDHQASFADSTVWLTTDALSFNGTRSWKAISWRIRQRYGREAFLDFGSRAAEPPTVCVSARGTHGVLQLHRGSV